MSTDKNNRLPVLAASLRCRFDKLEALRDATFDEEMQTAAEMLEARECHSDNTSFHHWLVDVDLMDRISKDDRAGCILMGRHPDLAREAHDRGTRSPQYIGRYIKDKIDRQASSLATKMTPPASSPVEMPVVVVQPEIASEPPEPKEASPKQRIKVQTKPPRILALIGKEHGAPIYERVGTGPTMKMLCDIAAAGGKAAVREYAGILRDRVEWRPIRTASVLTVRILHEGLGRNAIELPKTSAGLRRAISLALEEEKRAKEPPRPSLIDARGLVFAIETPAPTAKIEPFERPSVDADIVVYGTVIRRAGEYPEHYQEAWAAARFVDMIDGANGRPDRASTASRGVGYGTATHFLRCGATQMFCHYWQQIAYAMSKPVDLNAGIQIAPARMRAA